MKFRYTFYVETDSHPKVLPRLLFGGRVIYDLGWSASVFGGYMRLDFDIHDPKALGELAGLAVVATGLYWLVWRRSPKLANWLVFAGAVALSCQVVNWDYILNDYFRVRWKLP